MKASAAMPPQLPRAWRGRVAAWLCVVAGAGLAAADQRDDRACLAGRYVVASTELFAAGTGRDVVVFADDGVSIDGRCPPVKARVRRTRRAWRLAAVWHGCADARGRVRLRASIDDQCQRLAGKVVAGRGQRRAFVARRSVCGDGVTDAGVGEQCDGNGRRIVGLHFDGVPVPAGAGIRRAYVRFRVGSEAVSAAAFEVAGEAADTAPSFAAVPRNLSARPRTTARVSWSPAAWSPAAGAETPDLAAIVQEIVDRPAWSAGGTVGILVSGSGGRLATAYDGDVGAAPVLHVEWDAVADVRAVARTVPVPETIVIERRITASGDDAEERPSGAVDRTSTDLELVEDESRTQTVGMRFVGLEVPSHAVVLAAYVQLQVDEASDGPTVLRIEGEQAASSRPFAGTEHDLTARARTTAAAAWQPPPWRVVGAAGAEQRTPDVAAIVQELVDRDDWTPGNAVALLISGSGRRVAEAFDGDRAGAPLLHVEYAAATSTSTSSTSSTTIGVTVTVTVTSTSVTTTSTTAPPRFSVDVPVGQSAGDAEEGDDGEVVLARERLALGEAARDGCGGPCTDACACDGAAGPETPPVSFATVVQPIFTARCALSSCHGGAHPEEALDLRAGASRRSLVGATSTECPTTARVVPGAPGASYLIAKLEGRGVCFSGIRMPPGTPLTPAEIAAIKAWVEQGAEDD